MKTYELKLIKGGKGVFRVSVVKDGAVEADIVKFSKEENDVLTFADEDKQIIYSVAMRPNKLIYRKDINGEPANVFYTEETVEEAQINYFRNKGNTETNINHSEHVNAQGIFPFESWVVKDPESDKSKSLGLQTFKGDWVMGYKVDNDSIWNDYIKTGKLDGLSIEATHIKHELIPDFEMTKDEQKIQEEEKSFWEKLFGFSKQKVESFQEEDEPKEEEPVEVPAEMAEKEPKTEEVPVEEPKKEEPDTSWEEEKSVLEAKIANLEEENAKLKAEKVEAETKLETMSKQIPSAKPIKNTPPTQKTKSYAEMSNFEKLKFNRENK